MRDKEERLYALVPEDGEVFCGSALKGRKVQTMKIPNGQFVSFLAVATMDF